MQLCMIRRRKLDRRDSGIKREDIIDALRKVMDPELGRDLVSLGMVKEVEVDGSRVSVNVALTTPACPLKSHIERGVREAILSIPGVSNVEVKLSAEIKGGSAPGRKQIEGIKYIIAVASGKGGVGKSTVSANIAASLCASGAKTGILDADIYGPNIPRMLGLDKPPAQKDGRVVPGERMGIKVMSMGFFLREDDPVIWRGPMLHGVLQQFLRDVYWGELDYLIVDLPPGTGDAQLTLTQTVPLSGAIIVTTPQDVALLDARKGLSMFRKVDVPILGIIENMSYFLCPHCGERSEIFGYGGGKKVSEILDVPFLGEIPIITEIRQAGDEGKPIPLFHPNSQAGIIFREIAEKVASLLSIHYYSV